jgi:hypothetical protein
MVVAGALSLAVGVFAQTQETQETVATGPSKVKIFEARGELVAKGPNWLIARNPATGYHRVYRVQPGKKAIVDGVPKTLDQLEKGTLLKATATITETPVTKRTTTITKGVVFWASPKSVIVTLDNGDNKQYEVPEGFKFDIDGKQLSAMELKPGMKLTGTKIVEEQTETITTDIVVTGTAPK